jgi:hypothetical protein
MIDERGGPMARIAMNQILWLAGNPLGITGIIILLLLVFVFVHAYFTSQPPVLAGGPMVSGQSEHQAPAPYYARWVLAAVVVIVGVWLMSPYVDGQSPFTRIIVIGLLSAMIG